MGYAITSEDNRAQPSTQGAGGTEGTYRSPLGLKWIGELDDDEITKLDQEIRGPYLDGRITAETRQEVDPKGFRKTYRDVPIDSTPYPKCLQMFVEARRTVQPLLDDYIEQDRLSIVKESLKGVRGDRFACGYPHFGDDGDIHPDMYVKGGASCLDEILSVEAEGTKGPGSRSDITLTARDSGPEDGTDGLSRDVREDNTKKEDVLSRLAICQKKEADRFYKDDSSTVSKKHNFWSTRIHTMEGRRALVEGTKRAVETELKHGTLDRGKITPDSINQWYQNRLQKIEDMKARARETDANGEVELSFMELPWDGEPWVTVTLK